MPLYIIVTHLIWFNNLHHVHILQSTIITVNFSSSFFINCLINSTPITQFKCHNSYIHSQRLHEFVLIHSNQHTKTSIQYNELCTWRWSIQKFAYNSGGLLELIMQWLFNRWTSKSTTIIFKHIAYALILNLLTKKEFHTKF